MASGMYALVQKKELEFNCNFMNLFYVLNSSILKNMR